jgi:glycopeptide antibiotics resistance protein
MQAAMFNNDNHHASSNTTRWLTLAYAIVLIYVTLHPLSALRLTSASPWGFVWSGWSKVGVTAFDIWINIVAYMPLGFGLAWVVGNSYSTPRAMAKSRSMQAAVIASLLCAGLSFMLESLQSYSPVRVASIWDFACNTGGALFGAVFAMLMVGRLAWLARLLDACIAPHRGALWAVIGLWGLAQLHPQGWSFMTAPLSLLTREWLPTQGINMPLNAAQLQNLETVASVVALSGMLSLLRLGLHPRLSLFARALCLLFGLFVVLMWQALAYALQYGWGEWRLLANAGVISALGFIAAVYLAWALLPRTWVAVGAVMSLALHTALAQMLPAHPYTTSADLWQQGRLIHLYGLTSVVSALWPILALAALVLQSRYRDSNRDAQS